MLQIIADHLRKTKSSIEWVRFMSSHPKDFTDDVIDVIAKEDVICRHIHNNQFFHLGGFQAPP